jgi:hypothetical protein
MRKTIQKPGASFYNLLAINKLESAGCWTTLRQRSQTLVVFIIIFILPLLSLMEENSVK